MEKQTAQYRLFKFYETQMSTGGLLQGQQGVGGKGSGDTKWPIF